MSSEEIRSSFLFATCQLGAEQAVKEEFARDHRGLRPAFSRPGFLTFKSSREPLAIDQAPVVSCFARAQGLALGKKSGDELHDLAGQVWCDSRVGKLMEGGGACDLHVWQRDCARPGWRGFEPGPSPLAVESEAALRRAAHFEAVRRGRPPGSSPPGAVILDIVIVEPNEWWIGCHRAEASITRWPGGVRPVETPPHALSRAYGKMVEALAWARLPIAPGETIVELGCAPGGASQALLDRGYRVLGVDPAEVDPALLAEGGFEHLRMRAADVPRRKFRSAHWLASDMNVAPQYALDAVEAIVTHSETHVRGLLLTLKLLEWGLAAELPAYLDRVRDWGYRDVRARQLALAGQEVCVVALRSRAQRRIRRRPHRARRE